MEDQGSKIDKILEAVSPLIEKAEKIESHDEAIADLKTREDLTQQTLHRHITNKKIRLQSVDKG